MDDSSATNSETPFDENEILALIGLEKPIRESLDDLEKELSDDRDPAV
jgi:hypothetical protein